MAVPALLQEIRAALDNKLPLVELVGSLNEFTRTNSPDVSNELEDELLTTHRDVDNGFSPRQTEIFLAVLYHLRIILSPASIITTWFDLVLRPALREPRLPLSALHEASDLVVLALEIDTEKDEMRSKVLAFRRLLVHLYLLDAFNEGSGEDVITKAELDDVDRQKRDHWKVNLERVLLKHGIHKPDELMTELSSHFQEPSSRLQIFSLLTLFTSLPDFQPSILTLATHPLMSQFLMSLLVDNSSTTCSIGLTLIVKILPLFAVHASDNLKEILPHLLIILARVICWKERPATDAERDMLDPSMVAPALQLNPDVEWQRLEATFYAAAATPPSPHRFFSFLYYLFPCNLLRFLRTPHLYLSEHGFPSPFTQGWNTVLDPTELKGKAENLMRTHQCHPLIVWRDADEELSQRNFWANYNIARITSEATLLDSTNMALAIRARHAETQPLHQDDVDSSADDGASSSTESVHVVRSAKRVSLQDMIATSVALKTNVNVDIENPTSQWPSTLFGSSVEESLSRTPSALNLSRSPSIMSGSIRSHDELPSHVTQAIASLQRELVLLRNELNFELWLSRENVQHVGRLYQERSLSTNVEMERQGLYNKLRNYRGQVQSLEKELREQKEQASSAKNKYAEWNTELQSKLAKFRKDKEQWTKETAHLRSEANNAKALFEGQAKLLSEAHTKVFELETSRKETQHKIDRLRDYERQIEQHLKVQQLWNADWAKFNQQQETLDEMATYAKQLEIRLDSYGQCQTTMEEQNRAYRRQLKAIEVHMEDSRRKPRASEESVMLNTILVEKTALLKSNDELRKRNMEQSEQLEELLAMVEVLRGREGLVYSP